ncbi:MAG: class I tRNA ligase family protein, partial [Planctomycetaceae bacterium]|nr:class I tRNA ligase family protein [Planctomycetaceae bacterium]
MFQKVDEPNFIAGEHEMLRFWQAQDVFRKLQAQNADKPHWSFLDGPITANNPMGVHHAWGRTYKDAFQRYRAMTGRKLRYQNGFDCQGLWVEVEVEKELNLGTKTGIADYGIDKFVRECKKRVLKFAARQTEQSVRLGYWMEWDDPAELRKLSEHIGADDVVTLRTPKGETASGTAEALTAELGNPRWGGSYFTFSTENNETIWSFLKKCFERKKIYQGHDVMPWSGRAGSAYSQMEVADGRKLTTHRSCFVRFRLIDKRAARRQSADDPGADAARLADDTAEYLLVWTTTPWTLTSNVACAVNPDLEYVKLRAKKDGALYYFAKDNLEFKRLEKEFKEGFGRPEWSWPEGVGKLKNIAQLFKEQGGYEIEGTLKGAEMIGWRYEGPFDSLEAQLSEGGHPTSDRKANARLVNDRRSAIASDSQTIAATLIDVTKFVEAGGVVGREADSKGSGSAEDIDTLWYAFDQLAMLWGMHSANALEECPRNVTRAIDKFRWYDATLLNLDIPVRRSAEWKEFGRLMEEVDHASVGAECTLSAESVREIT